MSITHIGVENVAKYIEQVKPGKFKIYTDVSKVPIYASSTKDLVTEFIEFSSNIQNNKDGSIYKIALYVPHGGKATADRLLSETFFTYHAAEDQEIEHTKPIGAVGSMTEMFSLMSNMMSFVQPFASQKAENEILRSELENAPEENNTMTNLISSVLPLLIPKPGVGVAGVEASEVQSPTLTRALEILIKNDPNLAEHLMKLADLSENNPKLFDTLINQLSIL
tara:strand:+ start:531 stop:1199 length:669 start_codon:yes stop_codon:yes gene_type:complete